VEELIAEALASVPAQRRTTSATQLMGTCPAHRYVHEAIASIIGKLASAPAGTGIYPLLIPTALKLQGLKIAPWLPQDVRDSIDVYASTLDACGQNGLIGGYGEDEIRRAIDWAVARADAAPEPQQRPVNHQTLRRLTNWEIRV
jgi:hypothetical protein